MTRTQAIVALTALIMLFVLGTLDAIVDPSTQAIPGFLLKLSSAILVGIAIILIVGGLRNGNASSSGGSGSGSSESPEGHAGSAEDVGRRRGRTEMTDDIDYGDRHD